MPNRLKLHMVFVANITNTICGKRTAKVDAVAKIEPPHFAALRLRKGKNNNRIAIKAIMLYLIRMKDEVYNENICKIIAQLKNVFGQNPKIELDYNSDWELLCAIILSAQCTDKRTNAVTKILYQKFPKVTDIAGADINDLENIIRPCGMYHSKSRHVKDTAQIIVDKFNGIVPSSLQDLLQLSGVGQKSASVFLSEFYRIPAIGVDTHVARTAKRLGLTSQTAPTKIMLDLQKLTSPKNWRDLHVLLVLFGRYVCTAKKPKCNECKIRELCISPFFTERFNHRSNVARDESF
jgi:endonuclease-3